MNEGTLSETATRLKDFPVPYGREVVLDNLEYENRTPVLRMRIREGNRFTVMDLDPDSAAQLGLALCDWAKDTSS